MKGLFQGLSDTLPGVQNGFACPVLIVGVCIFWGGNTKPLPVLRQEKECVVSRLSLFVWDWLGKDSAVSDHARSGYRIASLNASGCMP